MDTLIYLLVMVLVLGVVIGGVYLSSKINADKEDYEFALVLLGLVNFISEQIDWKYKEGIADIMNIVLEAVKIVRDTVGEEVDAVLFKEYVLHKSEQLCEDRGIEVDDEFVKMLSMATDYLIDKK